MGDAILILELAALLVLAPLLVARLRGDEAASEPEERAARIARLLDQIAVLEEPRGACAGARARRRSRARVRRTARRS